MRIVYTIIALAMFCGASFADPVTVSGTWTKIGSGRGAVRVKSAGTIVVIQSPMAPTTQEVDAYLDGQFSSSVRMCGQSDGIWAKLANSDVTEATVTFEPDPATCSCSGRWTLIPCTKPRQH